MTTTKKVLALPLDRADAEGLIVGATVAAGCGTAVGAGVAVGCRVGEGLGVGEGEGEAAAWVTVTLNRQLRSPYVTVIS